MMLLDVSLRVLAVAALVGLVLRVMRVRRSGVRHAAWMFVLIAMLSMPLLTTIVPPIGIPFIPTRPAAAEQTAETGGIPYALPSSTTRLQGVAAAGSEPVTVRFEPTGVTVTRRGEWSMQRVLLVVYLLGVCVLLLHLAAGWHAVARLARGATPVAMACDVPVRESTRVATPLSAGVLRPSIILPSDWRGWPDEKLQACLAHERAHIRRRDGLVRLAARVNRCLYWFHPLAWWLERALAASAEEAADEAAVLVVGERQRYAAVLVDIAEAVRVRGGRVAWQGIGVDGTGHFERRVERVLRGEAGAMSRLRTAGVLAACATAILVVVACRQPQPAPPALAPNPEVAERLEQQKARQAEYERARNMTAAEVDALEQSLKRTPEDFGTLSTLRTFYQTSGQRVLGWNEMVARRRPHILWLIENHPEHDLAMWQVSAQADPVTYAEAKKRWLKHTASPTASEKVLANAALFFFAEEPRIAEELLLRYKASARLGELYASVVTGPTDPRNGAPLTAFDSDPYARDVRRRLLASSEAKVLSIAGMRLSRVYSDQNRQRFGIQLLQRAVQLDPNDARAREGLIAFEVHDREWELREKLRAREAALVGGSIAERVSKGWGLTPDEQRALGDKEPEALAAMPENERFELLYQLPATRYMGAESLAATDKTASDSSYTLSKRYAQDALALAPKFTEHPWHGGVVYNATVALAAHALREGDRASAVRYMLDATKAPASRALETHVFGLDMRLVNYLLKEGERESVAEFLERSAALRPADRERLLKDAGAIRAGQMPLSYQSMMSRSEAMPLR